MRTIAVVLSALLLVACGNITYQPPPVGEGLIAFTARDFGNAGDNFKAGGYAVEAQCMYDAQAKLGALPGQGVQYVVSGLFSQGSVAYMSVKSLLAVLGQGGLQLSPSCLQVVGTVAMSIASLQALRLPSATPGK